MSIYSRIILLMIITIVFAGCAEKKMKQNLDASSEFQVEKSNIVKELKEIFEKGMAGKTTPSNLTQLYKLHAQRMRMDMLEQFPYTKSYPYDQKKSLISAEDLTKLPFLTNACGFLIQEDIKINYPCLTKENELFDYLSKEDETSELINSFITQYNINGAMTPNMQQEVLMNAIDRLDFVKYKDQLFYAFFHMMLNEEWVANQKVIQALED